MMLFLLYGFHLHGDMMDSTFWILTAPVGARTKGMGDSFVAGKAYIYAPYINPSGLAFMTNRQFSLSYQSFLLGCMYANAGMVLPEGNNIFGIHLGWFDAGKFDILADDNSITESSVSIQNDWIIFLSYARTLGWDISMGVNVKYFNSRMAQQATISGWAGDVGLLWDFPDEKVTLGVVIQNMGKNLKYPGEENTLPLNLKFGISTVLVEDWDLWVEDLPPDVESITLYGD
ncbi:MAG: PorV/PorQ family protein, partial [Spirochaetes bacterium]|nr:PorV/PorQ family protein [Spirochaetota bacterium]